MFYQNKMKVFEAWLWSSHKNTLVSYYHHPGIQEWWAFRRQTFSEEFRLFLESSKKPDLAIRTIEEISQNN
jgi:hypothetical protein